MCYQFKSILYARITDLRQFFDFAPDLILFTFFFSNYKIKYASVTSSKLRIKDDFAFLSMCYKYTHKEKIIVNWIASWNNDHVFAYSIYKILSLTVERKKNEKLFFFYF